MHGRIPRRAARVGPRADELPKAAVATRVVGVVDDDGAKGGEGARGREGEARLAHPVGPGREGDTVDGQGGGAEGHLCGAAAAAAPATVAMGAVREGDLGAEEAEEEGGGGGDSGRRTEEHHLEILICIPRYAWLGGGGQRMQGKVQKDVVWEFLDGKSNNDATGAVRASRRKKRWI